jgi:hypothetical protein
MRKTDADIMQRIKHADLRHVQQPRLIVPGEGHIAFALFSEAIVAVSLGGGESFGSYAQLTNTDHSI